MPVVARVIQHVLNDELGCFAKAVLPDGLARYEYLDRADLDRIQARAPSKKGPWSTDPDEMRKVLVVGCIHGDEPQGIRIAQALAATKPSTNVDLWIIPTLNPDGVAAHTRQNAHGVDLNRNFPWRWRRLGSRGYRYYSGPRPLSEPETRLAARIILRLRPVVSIWFHQPYGLVDESGGDLNLERRFASLVGLPLVRLQRFPGSVVSWENHTLPGTTAFVVELPPGRLSPTRVRQLAEAVIRLARSL